MSRHTPTEARSALALINREGPERSFHALPSITVDRVLTIADEWSYRTPRNASGSRARCFYEFLQRLASRKESRV